MRLIEGSLRKLILETGEEAPQTQRNPNMYPQLLDQVLNGLYQVNKSLESAHQVAPTPEAKATIAGLHSDFFNTLATARGYIRQLKSGARVKPQ